MEDTITLKSGNKIHIYETGKKGTYVVDFLEKDDSVFFTGIYSKDNTNLGKATYPTNASLADLAEAISSLKGMV